MAAKVFILIFFLTGIFVFYQNCAQGEFKRRPQTMASTSQSLGSSNTAPVLSVTNSGDCNYPCAVTFTAQAFDPDEIDALEYSWSGCTGGDTAVATCTVTSQNPVTAIVTVNDGRGGEAQASSQAKGLSPNQAPQVSIVTSPNCTAPCVATFTAVATDPDGDPLTYAWSGCNTGATTVLNCNVTAQVNPTAVLTVSDGRGGQTQTAALVGQPLNRPPTAFIVSSGSCQWPCTATFTVHATDPDGDILSYQWSGCSPGVGLSVTCPVNGTVAVAATVTVFDGHGGQTQVSSQVIGLNRPPVVVLTSSGACVYPGVVTFTTAGLDSQGHPLTYDPEHDPLTYIWSGCASGTQPTATCNVSGPGSFTATVVVSDGHGGQAQASSAATCP
jgi:hypothetical protein